MEQIELNRNTLKSEMYFLCLAGRLTHTAIKHILETEKILMAENNLLFDIDENIEVLVIACLRYVAYRRNTTVDFERIQEIMNINPACVDRCYSYIAKKYEDQDLRANQMIKTPCYRLLYSYM